MQVIKKILLFFTAIIFLVACLKDNGNYKYKDLNSPTFYFSSYPKVYGNMGQRMTFAAKYFYAQADSLELEKNSEYEWLINDVVICNSKNLDIMADSLMEKIGLEECPSTGIPGFFIVKNKYTQIAFMHKITFYVSPKFAKGSWFILSKDGTHSKLSYQRTYAVQDAEGNYIYKYENYDDIFKTQNNSAVLAGNPIKIVDHWAKYISASVGATSILTDKVAYEINNEDLKIYSNIKDEFLSPFSSESHFVDIFHKSHYGSCLIDSDGNLYTRKMSYSDLGGLYSNIPYTVDNKISKFNFVSQADASASIRFIYDNLNNRLVVFNGDYSISPIAKQGAYDFDITDMGVDIKLRAICNGVKSPTTSVTYGYNCGFVVYDKAQKHYVSEFFTHNTDYVSLVQKGAVSYELPIKLNANSKIIAPESSSYSIPSKFKYAIFYTYNNELRYFDRATREDNAFITFDSDINIYSFLTCSNYKVNLPDEYSWMAVGLKSGEFFLVDISLQTPQIIESSRFNVGGEIVDVSLVQGKDVD